MPSGKNAEQPTETAAVLNKTVKQIDKLLQLGKKKIKPLLEKEGITGAFNS